MSANRCPEPDSNAVVGADPSGEDGAVAAPERPLRAWSAREKERLGTAVSGACDRWREEWGIEPRDARTAAAGPEALVVSPFDATADEIGFSTPAWRDVWPGLWWSYSAPPSLPARRVVGGEVAPHLVALSAALFEEPVTPWSSRGSEPGGGGDAITVADAVATGAWADWWARLAEASGGPEDAAIAGGLARCPPPTMWEAWSGSLLVTLEVLDGKLRLLFAGTRVERIVRPEPRRHGRGGPARLTPVWRAAGERKVQLRVTIPSFELDLGAIAGLRVGDVLQTAHPLESPLDVVMDDGAATGAEAVCGAFLGRSGGRRAADLRAMTR